MQTIAVYYEPKPKTYGFNRVENLVLIRLRLPSDEQASWVKRNKLGDESAIKYVMTVFQVTEDAQILLTLLFREKDKDKASEILWKKFDIEPDAMQIISPVELVFFQGPHFGDRWGIAESAFKVLEKGGVEILTAGCSGAALYLVVGKGDASRAIAGLKEVFQAPQ